MTDAELQAWHARLRDHKNHMTMQAHLTAVGMETKPKTSKVSKTKQDISEFV